MKIKPVLSGTLLPSRTRARTTGVCVFCCHKCHKWGGICVNTITTLERLLKNDSSVERKRHVVSHKTTRCFTQNEPLFYIKRHVVFLEKGNGMAWKWLKSLNECYVWGANGCLLAVYEVYVTLVTAKSAKSLLRVRAHVWDWSFSQLIIYGNGRLGFIQHQKEMLQKQVLQHLLLC